MLACIALNLIRQLALMAPRGQLGEDAMYRFGVMARPCALAALSAMAALLVTGAPVKSFAQDNGAGQAQDINNKKVTLNLENADIRYALKLLFQSVGANYTLDQGVQGAVTVSL